MLKGQAHRLMSARPMPKGPQRRRLLAKLLLVLAAGAQAAAAHQNDTRAATEPSPNDPDRAGVRTPSSPSELHQRVAEQTIANATAPDAGPHATGTEAPPVIKLSAFLSAAPPATNEAVTADDDEASLAAAVAAGGEQADESATTVPSDDVNELGATPAIALMPSEPTSTPDQPGDHAHLLDTEVRATSETPFGQPEVMVRSRKSSPEHPVGPSSAAGGQHSASDSTRAASPLDYDDFDADYQLKLADGGQNPNKRDFGTDRNAPTPPPWSALVAGQHFLFNSTAAAAATSAGLANESQQQAPPVYSQHYHHAPPIMPALLTIKSAQLTSQELSKARPHFLFYPDQYAEFAGANGAELAAANGDLLATATNLDEQRQRLSEQRPAAATGKDEAGASTSSSSSLSNATNSSASGQTISLLNGSPLVSKQSSLMDNLALHAANHSAGSNQKGQESALQVTTIVVDNSAPTEAPPTRAYSHRMTTFSPLPVARVTQWPTLAAAGSTSTQPAPPSSTGAPNSSQSHQWFNYPQPNLHQNPLLLHHILNKPPSFYVQTAATAATAAPQAASDLQPTTISSVLPQPTSSKANASGTTQAPSASVTGSAPEVASIIERPTYSAASAGQLQAINATLLQMQLNEMRTIASKGAAHSSSSQQWPPAPPARARDSTLDQLVHEALTKHEANGNLRNLAGPTRWPGNMLPHQMGAGNPRPQSVAQLHAEPAARLVSQVIGAPSLLQEIYTPRQVAGGPSAPPGNDATQGSERQAHPNGPGSLAANGSMSLSDEDMSTYVALLASLSSSNQTPTVEQQAQLNSSQQLELQQLANLLRLLQFRVAGDESAHLRLLEQPGASSWQAELMRGARLIGLSEEVQSQIYRDYLAPAATKSASSSSAPASRLAPAGPMEGSELAKSYASLASQAQAPSSAGRSRAPNGRDFYALPDGRDGKTPGWAERQQQQQQQQQQRQVAFIEALRSSLAQLHESKLHEPEPAANSSARHNLTTNFDLEFDENLANSSSRPAPDWLEKQLVQDSSLEFQYQQRQPPGLRPATPMAPSGARLAPVTLRPLGAPARSPIAVYPLRPLLQGPARQHEPAGPQPRLLWPVSPGEQQQQAAPYASQLAAEGSNRLALAAPALIRLNGPAAAPPALRLLPYQPQLQQRPIPLPTKIMLDRFPLTAAPAYLVKLPTLTGGTLTASGSLVAPQKFARRPPASFISATPLGALRFLSALTPPRMRLIAPHNQLVPVHQQAPVGLVQPASSTLHVHHTPMGLGAATHYSAPHYPAAPFHPMGQQATAHGHYVPEPQLTPSEFQQQQQQLTFSSQPPARFQMYPGLVGPAWPPGAGSSQSQASSASTQSTTTAGVAAGRQQQQQQQYQQPSQSDQRNPEVADVGEDAQVSRPEGTSVQGSRHGQQQQPYAQHSPTALSRLQQATASLVELTSLASLLDEMIGGSDFDASPALALANAINSLSAAQNAAHSSGQATSLNGEQSQTSSQHQAAGAGQQQQQQSNQQQQNQPAFLWRNLFASGLWRGQAAGQRPGASKLRDFSALERLLAHATNSASPNAARLKVKYIRVPVAVYESGAPAIGDNAIQLTTLGPQGGGPSAPGSNKQQAESAAAPGAELGSHAESLPAISSLGQARPSSTLASSPPGAQSAQQLGNPSSPTAAASNLNEFLFDEMSSESEPQSNYILNSMGQPAQQHDGGGASLAYLPIVGALSRPPNGFYPLASPMSAQQASFLDSLALAGQQQQQQQLAAGDLHRPTDATRGPSEEEKSSEARTKNKRRRKKGKRKGKKGLLFGADDDDDEHDDAEQEGGKSGDDDDDDDALTVDDLPIIESLISTLVHGAPASLTNQQQPPSAPGHGESMLTAASGTSGWRSGRAQHLRPFRLGSATRYRQQQQQQQLAPEASSSVLTYVQPASGLAIAPASPSGHFSKHRLRLGELVGALGARKLISSLLARRKSRVRTSKRVASVASGTTTTTAAAMVVTPASLVSSAYGHRRRSSSTTRAPSGGSVSFVTPWRKRRVKISWPNDRARTRAPIVAGARHKKLEGSQSLNNTTKARFVMGDNSQPLVYPAIAAYQMDSFARPARAKLMGQRTEPRGSPRSSSSKTLTTTSTTTTSTTTTTTTTKRPKQAAPAVLLHDKTGGDKKYLAYEIE